MPPTWRLGFVLSLMTPLHLACSTELVNFSVAMCLCLERTAAPRHVCTVPAAGFLQSSQDSPFQPFWTFLCCPWSDLCHHRTRYMGRLHERY